MAGYKVKVTGDKEVVKAFKSLGYKASDLSVVFGRIANEVAGDAKTLAPKITGRLAADVRPGKAKTKATVAVGRAAVPYAGPVNYGWRKRGIEPSLFMNRAADNKAAPSAEQIAAEMRRLINQTGLR